MWRSRIDDTAKPYLWSDADGVVFANAAEEEACERALLLQEDSTDSAINNISGVALQSVYPLDERIIEVRSATWGGHFLDPIDRTTLNDRRVLIRYGGYFEDRAFTSRMDWSTLIGTPRFYLQEQARTLTLIRKPTTAAPIHLSVYRFPTDPMVLSEPDRGPEIPRRYHLHLIDWMEHLSYDNTDADKGDTKKSADAETKFTRKFGPRLDADTQRSRRENRGNQTRMNPSW